MKDNTRLAQTGFFKYSGNLDRVVGIAINGVPLFGGNSETGLDPFFPAFVGQSRAQTMINVDECMGSYRYSSFYHYYSYSPCILNNLRKVDLDYLKCKDIPECFVSPMQYAIAGTDDDNIDLDIMGIAKDGHIIISPFKNSDGDLWQPCDVDACNGLTIDDQYYYAMTVFYPYSLGCFGPASPSY